MVKVGPDYPRVTIPHLRIVAGGPYGVSEIWSCTMKAASFATESAGQVFFSTLSGADNAQELNDLNTYLTGSSGGDGLASYADNFAVPAWKTFMTMMDSRAKLSYVKVNAFGTDDKQVNITTLDRQFTPVAGTTQCIGAFTSGTVLDFRTSHKSRGKASHSSIHLPVNPFVGADGEVQAFGLQGGTPVSAMQTAITAFLSKLNGPSSTGRQMLPAIIYTSFTGKTYKHPTIDRTPEANAIDSWLLSSLPGITRRRGNKLKQAGVIQSLDYGAVA